VAAEEGQALRVTPAAGSFVECPEPEGLAACRVGGAGGGLCLAVSGRGVQMFHCE
jgi:hypothetical protein